jgi:hypothetical protein
MGNRRDFFQQSFGAMGSGLLPAGLVRLWNPEPLASRSEWLRLMLQVAEPVVANLAKGTFSKALIFEGKPGQEARKSVASLEAFGRCFCGIAPWLNLPAEALSTEEKSWLQTWKSMALAALLEGIQEKSPDCFQFTIPQCLVDTAFLVYGLLQGEQVIWHQLTAREQQQLVSRLVQTRQFKPYNNNWLLFAAMVETFFQRMGYPHLQETIDHAISQHVAWYKGDGWFGDGPEFHLDYYNSLVIQPLLLENLGPAHLHRKAAVQVAQRYATQLELLIHPDGSYPPMGRSLTYRCGAFHHLAYMAYKDLLPENLSPGQVKKALQLVIHKTLPAPANYQEGWLKIGLTGAQPGLGESYITTASLYLCLSAFMPLGLQPEHAFWQQAAQLISQEKIFAGIDAPADQALKGMPFPGKKE